MPDKEPDFSRVNRKRNKNRSNLILNGLIGLVIVLIIIVGATIVFGNKDKTEEKEPVETVEQNDTTEESAEDATVEEDQDEEDDMQQNSSEQSQSSGLTGSDKDSSETEGQTESNPDTGASEDDSEGTLVTVEPTDDQVVTETVTNDSWAPVGTAQSGEHVSSYDGESVDWNEKKKALAYATGLSEDSMIFWKIKNGGGPQKSIGIVSTRDKSQMYRVYLEWVDGQGWKPVKMDKLSTLDFDY
ncbi:cytoskeletal protein RodZ [Sporosarcina luteola]|nr:cytoskeletal protein RodZ [Sporosarcina luteola]